MTRSTYFISVPETGLLSSPFGSHTDGVLVFFSAVFAVFCRQRVRTQVSVFAFHFLVFELANQENFQLHNHYLVNHVNHDGYSLVNDNIVVDFLMVVAYRCFTYLWYL